MSRKFKIYFIVILCVIVLFLASPALKITQVNITGNNTVSSENILKSIEYKQGDNIIAFSKSRNEKELLKNPYIASAEIEKDIFKRTVDINIVERKVSGYVKYNSTNYLYVDKEGRILEINSYFVDSLPVVEGLKINDGFVVGEILKVDNKSAFDTMVALSNLFEKYEIEQDIIRVDVSNENEIHFFYGNIDVQLGNRDDLDLKVRYAMTILPEIEEYKQNGGYLILDDINAPRFKYNS